MTTGEKIRLQRKRSSITQEDLSRLAGVSLKTIQYVVMNKGQRKYTEHDLENMPRSGM